MAALKFTTAFFSMGMLVKRDPNMTSMIELNSNFYQGRPAEMPMTDVDPRIVKKLYTCPICLGKLLSQLQGVDHITRFHRIKYEDQIRLRLTLAEQDV